MVAPRALANYGCYGERLRSRFVGRWSPAGSCRLVIRGWPVTAWMTSLEGRSGHLGPDLGLRACRLRARRPTVSAREIPRPAVHTGTRRARRGVGRSADDAGHVVIPDIQDSLRPLTCRDESGTVVIECPRVTVGGRLAHPGYRARGGQRSGRLHPRAGLGTLVQRGVRALTPRCRRSLAGSERAAWRGL
jgi:hypothetical protein